MAHSKTPVSREEAGVEVLRGHRNVGESTSGGSSRNKGELREQEKICAPFLSGP
ncbi:hypothetical protein Scep_026748 [Stephania cephalantha]|uniref:Uncharacterized protein n=1 Tax=Stephania cephalantha TaxID=152367 RepID=A0AAP0HQR5_9MAGN